MLAARYTAECKAEAIKQVADGDPWADDFLLQANLIGKDLSEIPETRIWHT